jgi:copper chaperone CopZ
MKRNVLAVPAVLAALCLATSAWAGGSMCSGKSEGAAKQTEAGAKCSTTKGAATEASAKGAHCVDGATMTSKGQCTIGADNAVFSFAVKDVHCEACVTKIQTAAMAQKGVLCAKVNVDTKTAYVAGNKNLDQRVIAKAIKGAGYKCSLKAQGPKARAEMLKEMAVVSTPKKDKV